MQHEHEVQNHPVTSHTVGHSSVVDRAIAKVGHMFDSPHAAGSTKTTLGLDNPEHSYPKRTGGLRDPSGKHGLTNDFGAAQTGDYGGAVGNPKPEYNTMGVRAIEQTLASGGPMDNGMNSDMDGNMKRGTMGAGTAGAGMMDHNSKGAAFGDHDAHSRSSLESNASSAQMGAVDTTVGGLTNARVVSTYTTKTDPSMIAEFDHPHARAGSVGGKGLFNSHAGEPGGIEGDHNI